MPKKFVGFIAEISTEVRSFSSYFYVIPLVPQEPM